MPRHTSQHRSPGIMNIAPDQLFAEFSVVFSWHDHPDREFFIRVETCMVKAQRKVESFIKVQVKWFSADLFHHQPEKVKSHVAVKVFPFFAQR